MKKVILFLLAFSWLITAMMITSSCNTPGEKVENAQQNVQEAKKDAKENVQEAQADLDKAKKEYMEDVNNYRREMSDKFVANERSIAEFNAKIANEKKSAKIEYQKRIAELEQKNNNMKRKMDDYKVDTRENWESFKREFNSDMDNLGKSFKDFTVNNKK